ncbi:MAG: stage II sporulation protein E, partial [Rikenellaceae bacterium]
MLSIISDFDGKRVICGYHLAKLISSLSGTEIIRAQISADPDVQPLWYMSGVDLITESLVTLNKIYYLL